MPAAHAAFIRNVMHGRKGFDVPRLLATMTAAGAVDARTHLTTGNVSFVAEDPGGVVDAATLDLERMLGHREEIFLRTRDELAIITADDVHDLVPDGFDQGIEVSLSLEPLPRLDLPHLWQRRDMVVFHATERELFTARRLVDGRTSSPGGRLERLTGLRLTTRAITTIERVRRAVEDTSD